MLWLRSWLVTEHGSKLSISQRTIGIAAAFFLASVVGRAHARQMDANDRKRWRADLNRNRLKSLDAPSWLWKSAVEKNKGRSGTGAAS